MKSSKLFLEINDVYESHYGGSIQLSCKQQQAVQNLINEHLYKFLQYLMDEDELCSNLTHEQNIQDFNNSLE